MAFSNAHMEKANDSISLFIFARCGRTTIHS